MRYHVPVLLEESVNGLCLRPGGIFIDATFGGGGHSDLILKKLKGGKLFAFDQDEDAAKNVNKDKRFVFINQNFRFMQNFLKLYVPTQIDGILADLGISSNQIDVPERGFSTRFDSKLDMRMNRLAKLTAADVLNNSSHIELRNILLKYGEVNNAHRLALAIINSRNQEPVTTVNRLKLIAKPFAQRGRENKYYAQIFQALRIEVNDEITALKEMLTQAEKLLRPGGRLVIIAYHSLEDRLVKNFMKKGKFLGEAEKDLYGNPLVPFKVITRKPITPEKEEKEQNNRARSAKLRIAEKL